MSANLDIRPEDTAAVAALLKRLRAREAKVAERQAVKAAIAGERDARIAYWSKHAASKTPAVSKYAARRVAVLKAKGSAS